MASFDMNKPATSTWTSSNVARSNAGKTIGGQPARGKMASESETKSAPGGNRTTSVASNMDLPIWQTNVALELSLLLSMYNANNLSLMANSGSISPFGLFPLALPVPSVPVVAQNQESGRVPTTLERLVPKGVPKASSGVTNLAKSSALQMPLNGAVSAIDMSQTRDHGNLKVAEKSASRSSFIKASSVRRNKGQQNLNSHLSYHMNGIPGCSTSRERPAVSPSAENVNCGLVVRPGMIPMQNSHAKRTVGSCLKEGMMSPRVSCNPPAPDMSLNSAKASSSGNYQAMSRKKMGNGCNVLTQPGRNEARIIGSYAARTIPLPPDSQVRDAEAAAILLGLRHGLDEPSGTSAVAVGNPPSVGSMQVLRAHENSNKAHAKRTVDKSTDFSQAPPAQAVDLSTKTKLKLQCVPRPNTINSKHNITKQTLLRSTERQGQLCTAASKVPASQMNQLCRNEITDCARSVSSPPRKDGSLQIISPQFRPQPIASHSESTSVVSHLPSCICAFDNPSSVEGCSANCEQGRILQGNQLQQPLTGFNFKKAICEKFSQATTCDARHSKEHSTELSRVKHSYAVAESTSRAHLQPTWSQKHPYMPTHTSAIQKSAKGREHARGTEQPSYDTPTAGIQMQSPQAGSAAHLVNNRLKSRVQPPIRLHEKGTPKAAHDGTEKSRRAINHVARTSSSKTTTASPTTQATPVTSQRSDFKHTIPSFSALRQKSFEFRNSFNRTDNPSRTISGEILPPEVSNSDGGQAFNIRLPASNLYRIRNSGLGGSNDSLHSDRSGKEAQKQDSGDESDSSGSGSDSDSSGAGNSDESDVESDHEASRENGGSHTVENGGESSSSSPSRCRFILSRPKFTLGPGEANAPKKRNSLSMRSGSASSPENSASSPSSKVKIRKPTFTFSSNGSSETKPTYSAGTSTKIPELKCDADEGQNSFKFKLIQALSKPDSKEGVAVDGKSLRALVGEADYFYHNNKKYVLKRYLKKTKPRETNVTGTNGGFQTNKNVRRDVNNNDTISERRSQPRIEPRISVTARKRTEVPDPPTTEPKKAKKLKKPDIDTRRKKKGVFEHVGGEERVKLETKSAAKHGIPRNKRRRRIHEIDNLVFEGAGGLTPIPDLSLRDSDVFSNIKLRRREAAKKVITEPSTEKDDTSTKTSLRTKWLKTAAHKRAIANKNRKKSIEKKLRKYQKKNRLFVIKHSEPEQETSAPRSSCVRINAGIARPHLDPQAFAITGDTNTSHEEVEILGHKKSSQDCDSICTVKPESKQTIEARGERHGIKVDNKVNKVDEIARKGAKDITVAYESKQCWGNAEKESVTIEGIPDQRSETPGSTDEGGRRVSKRISERKLSLDHSCDVKKPDDDVTICDSDSVRSESPLLSTNRGRNQRKRRFSSKGRASPSLVKLSSSKANRSGPAAPRGRGFTLFSCFPAPSAMTLAAAYGDLQASYSMKGLSKLTNNVWEVGSNALDTKQQLQRETWRNMTLDMFTNGNKVSVDNS